MDKVEFGHFVHRVVKMLVHMEKDEKDIRFSRKTSPTGFEKLVVDASWRVVNGEKLKCAIDYTEGGACISGSRI